MRIEFHFDFISPYSYLAQARMKELAEVSGADIAYLPLNLPRLIKLTGNTPPASVPNKARYLLRDVKRQASRLGLPLKVWMPGSFDSRPALYIACGLQGDDRTRFTGHVFADVWSGRVEPTQPGWVEQIIKQNALPAAWIELQGEEQRKYLMQTTEDAARAGLFGVPSFVVRSSKPELYFGLDHMDEMAAYCKTLARQRETSSQEQAG